MSVSRKPIPLPRRHRPRLNLKCICYFIIIVVLALAHLRQVLPAVSADYSPEGLLRGYRRSVLQTTQECTEGDLRLVRDGSVVITGAPPDGAPGAGVIVFCNEGRWNVFYSGSFDYDRGYSPFNTQAAPVVCRQLGWSTGVAVVNAGLRFGGGVNATSVRMMYANNVSCAGTEARLKDCTVSDYSPNTTVNGTGRVEAYGAYCESETGVEGQLRLIPVAGGSVTPGSQFGVVQMFRFGFWTSMGLSHGDDVIGAWQVALVACRQLGRATGFKTYTLVDRMTTPVYGPNYRMDLSCSGAEAALWDGCSPITDYMDLFDVSAAPTASLFADTLECRNATECTEDGAIRLVAGSGSGGSPVVVASDSTTGKLEGTLQVCMAGTWARISSRHPYLSTGTLFGSPEAVVACRQLGRSTGVPVNESGVVFGGGVPGPALYGEFGCVGNETRLVSQCGRGYWGVAEVDASGSNSTFGVSCEAIELNECTEGDLRLVVNGSVIITGAPPDGSPAGGVIEFCKGGRWSVLSPPDDQSSSSYYDNFGLKEALVACRQLGWSSGVAVSDAGFKFGGGVAAVVSLLVANVSCTGSEARLADCTVTDYYPGVATNGSGRNDTVGVYCETAGVEGQLRLLPAAGGSGLPGSTFGIVQMFYSGYWAALRLRQVGGTLDDWQIAKVACRQLGWANGFIAANPADPTNPAVFGPISRLAFTCSGSEAQLLNGCSLTASSIYTPYYSAAPFNADALECRTATECTTNGALRLVDDSGAAPVEIIDNSTSTARIGGTLQFCQEGMWASLASFHSYYYPYDGGVASAACRQLGWPSGTTVVKSGTVFGGGVPGPVLNLTISCDGYEVNMMSQCRLYYWGLVAVDGGNNNDTVGVSCQAPVCTDGDLRLVVNGSVVITGSPPDGAPGRGVVLFCKNGRWNVVSTGNFDYLDPSYVPFNAGVALVVCRQLGWSSGVAVLNAGMGAYGGGVDAAGVRLLYTTNMRCAGTETRLVDCNITEYNPGHWSDGTGDYRVLGAYCESAGVEGELRLIPAAGGSGLPGSTFGIIQMFYGGYWTSLVSGGWQVPRAACRQLGWATGLRAPWVPANPMPPVFGPTTYPNFSCNGTETQLLNGCSLTSSHVVIFDVRVTTSDRPLFADAFECRNATECTDDDALRLVTGGGTGGAPVVVASNGTTGKLEGTLQFCMAGTWGSLAITSHNLDIRFGSPEATVACRQLGRSMGVAVTTSGAVFGGGVPGPAFYGDFSCVGNETRLVSQCRNGFYWGVVQFDASGSNSTFGVSCEDSACTEGDLRLVVNGSVVINGAPSDGSPAGGVIVFCRARQWTVLQVEYSLYEMTFSGLGPNEAVVACRQLGWSTGALVGNAGIKFGGGVTAPAVVMRSLNFTCSGSEARLADCATAESYPAVVGDGTRQNATFGLYCESTVGAEGQLRLVPAAGGSGFPGSTFGIVQVFHSGYWAALYLGTYSLTPITTALKVAQVACRQLGWATGLPTVSHYSPASSDPPVYGAELHLSGLSCNGTETRLLSDCSAVDSYILNVDRSDIPYSAVAMECYSATECTDGDLRLVNGSSSGGSPAVVATNTTTPGQPIGGTLQMCLGGIWASVSSHNPGYKNIHFGIMEASVVCRQLGLSTAVAVNESGALFGGGVHSPVLYVASYCDWANGTRLLTQCNAFYSDIATINGTNTNSTIGVFCDAPVCTNGDVRLVRDGGSTVVTGAPIGGIVEFCKDGRWNVIRPLFASTSGDDEFGAEEAAVTCRQLGWGASGAMASYSGLLVGGGVTTAVSVLILNVNCTGTEARLADCKVVDYYDGMNFNGTLRTDIMAVSCDSPSCTEGDLRLVRDGNETITGAPPDGSPRGGSILLCRAGQWTVIQPVVSQGSMVSSIGAKEAAVMCRQLGWSTGVATAVIDAGYKFGGGVTVAVGMIRLNASCEGSEARLVDCTMTEVFPQSPMNGTGRNDIMGVYCGVTECTDGDVRLVRDGSDIVSGAPPDGSPTGGTIAFCRSGVWSVLAQVISQLYGVYGNSVVAEALVVCRQLGWSTGALVRGAGHRFGGGVTPAAVRMLSANAPSSNTLGMLLLNVSCTGAEERLADCAMADLRYTTNGTNRNDTVGVYCESVGLEGQLRLIPQAGGSGLPGSQYGIVQMSYSGFWATLELDEYNVAAARVACGQMGWATGFTAYSWDLYYWENRTNPVFGPTLQSSFTCNGTEARLLNGCSLTWTNVYDPDAAITPYVSAVECRNATECADGDIRLVHGSDFNGGGPVASTSLPANSTSGQRKAGTLQLCVAGIWASLAVHDDLRGYDPHFGSTEATVACRQWGLAEAAGVRVNDSGALFGGGVPSPVLSLAIGGCTREAVRLLTQCGSSYIGVVEFNGINTTSTIGVSCDAPACSEGDLRLVGPGNVTITSASPDGNPRGGLIEVCSYGQWVVLLDYVSNDSSLGSFGLEEARVACRQLGWSSGAAVSSNAGPRFGVLSTPAAVAGALVADLTCAGTEARLADCLMRVDSSLSVQTRNNTGVNGAMGLYCEPAGVEGQLRLVAVGNGSGLPGSQFGIVQMFRSGYWAALELTSAGGVSISLLSYGHLARVACRQLGWATGYMTHYTEADPTAPAAAMFGPVVAVAFNCSGSEMRLLDGCSLSYSYLRSGDVGDRLLRATALECRNATTECMDGDMRLINGCINAGGAQVAVGANSENKTTSMRQQQGAAAAGSLQVCLAGIWASVSSRGFDVQLGREYYSFQKPSFGSAEAEVACRQLGWSTGVAVMDSGALFGGGVQGPVLYLDVRCDGHESRLLSDCQVAYYGGVVEFNGNSTNATIGVSCYGVSSTSPPPPSRPPVDGGGVTSPLGPINFNGSSVAVTAVTATAVAVAAAASITAGVAGAAAGSSGASAVAASGVSGLSAVQAATALTTFISHMQFFPLTTTVAANLSANYVQVNSDLRWVVLVATRRPGIQSSLSDAYSQVVISGALLAATLLLHWALFRMYCNCRWLRFLGLPGLFVVPFLELVAARITLVPLAYAATVLLALGAGTGRAGPLVLGSFVVAFVTTYLGSMAWAVLRIHTGRTALDLSYKQQRLGTGGGEAPPAKQSEGAPAAAGGGGVHPTGSAGGTVCTSPPGVRPLRETFLVRMWDKLNRGRWNRPTGEEVQTAQLEAHRVSMYLRKGMSLVAAARCLYPKSAAAQDEAPASAAAAAPMNRGGAQHQIPQQQQQQRSALGAAKAASSVAADTSPSAVSSLGPTILTPAASVQLVLRGSSDSEAGARSSSPAVSVGARAAPSAAPVAAPLLSAGAAASAEEMERHRRQACSSCNEGGGNGASVDGSACGVKHEADCRPGSARAGPPLNVGAAYYSYDATLLLPPPPLAPPPPPPAPPPLLPPTSPALLSAPASAQPHSPTDQRSPSRNSAKLALIGFLDEVDASWDSCSSYTEQQSKPASRRQVAAAVTGLPLLPAAALAADACDDDDSYDSQPQEGSVTRPAAYHIRNTPSLETGVVATAAAAADCGPPTSSGTCSAASSAAPRAAGSVSRFSSRDSNGRAKHTKGRGADAAADGDDATCPGFAWGSPTAKAAVPTSLDRVWTFSNAYLDVDAAVQAGKGDEGGGDGVQAMATDADAADAVAAAAADSALAATAPSIAPSDTQSRSAFLHGSSWSNPIGPYRPPSLQPLASRPAVQAPGRATTNGQATASSARLLPPLGPPPLGPPLGPPQAGSSSIAARRWSEDVQQQGQPTTQWPPQPCWRYSLGQQHEQEHQRQPPLPPTTAAAVPRTPSNDARATADEGAGVAAAPTGNFSARVGSLDAYRTSAERAVSRGVASGAGSSAGSREASRAAAVTAAAYASGAAVAGGADPEAASGDIDNGAFATAASALCETRTTLQQVYGPAGGSRLAPHMAAMCSSRRDMPSAAPTVRSPPPSVPSSSSSSSPQREPSNSGLPRQPPSAVQQRQQQLQLQHHHPHHAPEPDTLPASTMALSHPQQGMCSRRGGQPLQLHGAAADDDGETLNSGGSALMPGAAADDPLVDGDDAAAAAQQLTTACLTGDHHGAEVLQQQQHQWGQGEVCIEDLATPIRHQESLAAARPRSSAGVLATPSKLPPAVGPSSRGRIGSYSSSCNGSRVWQEQQLQQQQQQYRASNNSFADIGQVGPLTMAARRSHDGSSAASAGGSFNSVGGVSHGNRHQHHHFTALLPATVIGTTRSTPVLACSSTVDEIEAPSQLPAASATAAAAAAKGGGEESTVSSAAGPQKQEPATGVHPAAAVNAGADGAAATSHHKATTSPHASWRPCAPGPPPSACQPATVASGCARAMMPAVGVAAGLPPLLLAAAGSGSHTEVLGANVSGTRREPLQLVEEEEEGALLEPAAGANQSKQVVWPSGTGSGGGEGTTCAAGQEKMGAAAAADMAVIKAAPPPAEGELDPAGRALLARCEVFERFGALFEDHRGDRLLASTFYLALLLNALVPAVLMGLQPGLRMAPGSVAAIAINTAVLAFKISFVVYVAAVFPYRNLLFFVVEVACYCLEAAICVCIVVLTVVGSEPRKAIEKMVSGQSGRTAAGDDTQQQIIDDDRRRNEFTHTVSDTMFLIEIVTLGTQVTFLFLKAVVPFAVAGMYFGWTACWRRCHRRGATEAAAVTRLAPARCKEAEAPAVPLPRPPPPPPPPQPPNKLDAAAGFHS